MRILYHHRTRAADAQGIHIAEMVRAFSDLGHEVRVAALVQPGSSPAPQVETAKPLWQRLIERIPFFYELLQLGYNPVGLALLIREIRAFRPHFLYERYSLFNFAGAIASRLFRIPLILEANSPLADETRDEGLLKLYRFGLWSERRICHSAHAVLAVTGALKQILTTHGVNPALISVIPNGVSPQLLATPQADPALRASLGLENRLVIGFVGWFRPWHGLETLIEAFHDAGLPARGVSLLLVGDGPAMADLQTLVARLGLESSVRFTGPLPHHAVAAHIALFDVAAQPAANPYCCPMKILEYFALGKPILAPAQPNILELLDPGTNSLVFPPGDRAALTASLRDLFADPSSLQSLTAGARSTIERRGFLWSRNAERVIALLPDTPR